MRGRGGEGGHVGEGTTNQIQPQLTLKLTEKRIIMIKMIRMTRINI